MGGRRVLHSYHSERCSSAPTATTSDHRSTSADNRSTTTSGSPSCIDSNHDPAAPTPRPISCISIRTNNQP